MHKKLDNMMQIKSHIIPVHIVVLQASLAVYCPACSCGMKTMDLPDDMQAASQQTNKQLQYTIC